MMNFQRNESISLIFSLFPNNGVIPCKSNHPKIGGRDPVNILQLMSNTENACMRPNTNVICLESLLPCNDIEKVAI